MPDDPATCPFAGFFLPIQWHNKSTQSASLSKGRIEEKIGVAVKEGPAGLDMVERLPPSHLVLRQK